MDFWRGQFRQMQRTDHPKADEEKKGWEQTSRGCFLSEMLLAAFFNASLPLLVRGSHIISWLITVRYTQIQKRENEEN